MGNAFSSMYSGLDLTDDAHKLRLLWEDFVTDDENRSLQMPIRNSILNSWKRCHSRGVNPYQTYAREGLTVIQLEQLYEESKLYAIGKPIIDAVFQQITGSGYLITLNDENGKMIYLKGEREILRKTEKVNFTVGMDWSEEAAGTNAIGTSIVTKMPIQIFATEHFCEGFQDMTCSSAPIFQPHTRKVIGAVDITGLWPNGKPHTLGLAVAIAQAIERELAILHMEKYNYLMQYYYQKITQWKDSPMLIVSDDFILVYASAELQKSFRLKVMMDLKEHPNFFRIACTLNEHNYEETRTVQLVQDNENHDYTVDLIQPVRNAGETVGYIILFRKRFSDVDTYQRGQSHLKKKYPIAGNSASLVQLLNKAEKIAITDVPVLLSGETGTGKEVITRVIHHESKRNKQPFIAVNCGAIQKELIASELFGYESGTFTGGNKEGKKGSFEVADGGTLFLDEIGEMPLDQQVLLLRAIEEKEITRLGSSTAIKVNVRIIAATNRNLEEMVERGEFRSDLFYRLNVVTLEIPPLRSRKEDVLQLSNYFLQVFSEKYETPVIPELTAEAEQVLTDYRWPGNIRELRNAMEHAIIFNTTPAWITLSDLPNYLLNQTEDTTEKEKKEDDLPMLDHIEKEQIQELLHEENWNISAVSKKLSIARSTLYRKIEKYQLK